MSTEPGRNSTDDGFVLASRLAASISLLSLQPNTKKRDSAV